MKRETILRLKEFMEKWLQDPCPGCGSDLQNLLRQSWAELAHDYEQEGLEEHEFDEQCPYCGAALMVKVDVSPSFVCELKPLVVQAGPVIGDVREVPTDAGPTE